MFGFGCKFCDTKTRESLKLGRRLGISLTEVSFHPCVAEGHARHYSGSRKESKIPAAPDKPSLDPNRVYSTPPFFGELNHWGALEWLKLGLWPGEQLPVHLHRGHRRLRLAASPGAPRRAARGGTGSRRHVPLGTDVSDLQGVGMSRKLTSKQPSRKPEDL